MLDQDEKLRLQVTNDYLWAANYRAQFIPDWERYYKLYKSYIDSKKYPFESKLFIPYIFAVIEVQLPNILQTIFSNGQFLEVEGRNTISQELSSSVKEVIAYQFERNIRAHTLSAAWIKQMLIYGTSPAFADWSYITQATKRRVPVKTVNGDIAKIKTVKGNIVRANNPIAGVIDVFRYFQCPTTTESPASSDNVLFAGYEFQRSYEELLRDAKNGIYDLDAVKSLKGRTNNSTVDPMENRLTILNKTSLRDNIRNARDLKDCINYYGMIPNQDGELEFRLITLCFPAGLQNDKLTVGEAVIIRNELDPLSIGKIPIVLARCNLLEGELYGMGDVQVVESLQVELNDQRNQRCDNVVRSMNQMWKVKRGSEIDEAMLEYRPNGIIELDEPGGDLVPLVPNTVQLNQSLTEESVIKQDIQFATGVSDFVAGTFQNTTGFNDTATGISLIQAAAQGRMVLKSQFIQVAIKELAELVWSLDQQKLPFDTVIKVLDPFSAAKFRYIRTSPELINGQYDFSIVNAPSTGNPQIRRQQLIQVVDAISKIIPSASEAGQPIQINYDQLILRILKEFNIPNIAEILPNLANTQLMNNIPGVVNELANNGESLDPETENQLIDEGDKDLDVHPGDDDLAHIISHQNHVTGSSPEKVIELNKHVSKHSAQMEKKRLLLFEVDKTAATQAKNGAQVSEDPTNEISNMLSSGGLSSPDGAGGQEQLIRDQGNANQIRGA